MNKILITGIAGFIGFHLTKRLLEHGYEVYGVDSLNDYYCLKLKSDRLAELGISVKQLTDKYFVNSQRYPNLTFEKLDITDYDKLIRIFTDNRFDYVINLAAQPGVRYSLENPKAYIKSNIEGFFNILEVCRHFPIKHLIYASSSSVYGLSNDLPLKETQRTDNPISLYAASKKSNEIMAYTYSHLYKIPTTGLRFFTVYGPWGRPDMSPYLFTNSILNGLPINVFNFGEMMRDFTYIDDIVISIHKLLLLPPIVTDININNPITETLDPYRILNIGNNSPIKLIDFINQIEEYVHKKAIIVYKEIQKGDVKNTHADNVKIANIIDYIPQYSLKIGIKNYIDWFKKYYIN